MRKISKGTQKALEIIQKNLFFMGVILTLIPHLGCRQGAKEAATDSTPSPSVSPSPSASPSPSVSPTPSTQKTIRVSWSANREQAVNQSGGGYRVYYSTQPNFSLSGASSVNVPYVSGAQAPTTVDLTQLTAGTTYYVKIVAYSSILPAGSSSGATSSASTEVSLSVP